MHVWFFPDAEHDPNAAPECDYSNCTLPDCYCSRDGTLIPGNLEVQQVCFADVMVLDLIL